jgi:hypothetical protein
MKRDAVKALLSTVKEGTSLTATELNLLATELRMGQRAVAILYEKKNLVPEDQGTSAHLRVPVTSAR